MAIINAKKVEHVAVTGPGTLDGQGLVWWQHRDKDKYDKNIKIFNKKTNTDMQKDKRAMQKLRREVEKAKRALSSTHQARLEIEALFDGHDFSETLTRARFEEINNDLFKKTLQPVKHVMEG